jgi:hypothetical protein
VLFGIGEVEFTQRRGTHLDASGKDEGLGDIASERI